MNKKRLRKILKIAGYVFLGYIIGAILWIAHCFIIPADDKSIAICYMISPGWPILSIFYLLELISFIFNFLIP